MSDHPSTVEEMRELWYGFVEHNLTSQQAQRLDYLIKTDAEARVEYVELMNMRNTLASYLSPKTIPADDSLDSDFDLGNILSLDSAKAPGTPKGTEKVQGHLLFDFLQNIPGYFSSNMFQVFVLLVLLLPPIFAFLTVLNSSRHSSPVIPAPTRNEGVANLMGQQGVEGIDYPSQGHDAASGVPSVPSDTVAQLMKTISADWDKGLHEQLKPGSYMLQGEKYILHSGFAELRFPHSARVIVQGPATFVPTSHGVLQLESGRCVAHVPPMASGFTIESNGSQIVDIGTEFGVEAKGDLETDVYVFKGKVELAIKDGPPGNKIELSDFEGVSSSAKTGIISSKEIDTDRFVRRLDAPGVLAALPLRNASFEIPDLTVTQMARPDGMLCSTPIVDWQIHSQGAPRSPHIGYYVWSPKQGPYYNSGVTDGKQACVLMLRDGNKPNTSEWIFCSLGLIQPLDTGHTLRLSVDCGVKTPKAQQGAKITAAFTNMVSKNKCGPFVGEVGSMSGADVWENPQTINASIPITTEMVGRELFVVIRVEDQAPGSAEDRYMFDNLKIEVW